MEHPEAGDLIRGTGGLRKIRWQQPGRGKRGGVRVIYYWAAARDILLMLFAYGKTKQEDLTPQQKTVLKRIVEDEYP